MRLGFLRSASVARTTSTLHLKPQSPLPSAASLGLGEWPHKLTQNMRHHIALVPSLAATRSSSAAAFQCTCRGNSFYSRQRLSHMKLNVGGFGLTDDGDFAILGVNVKDPDDDDDDTTVLGQSINGGISSMALGTIFDQTSSQAATAPVSQTISSDDHNTASKENGPHEIKFSINKEIKSEIREYIMEVMPTVSEDDVERYSIGLGKIGFSPTCITMCELKLEDLDFMKVLHRRYFFNEVTGVDHPWEV